MSPSRRALAVALALLLTALIGLEAGLWTRTETHVGPFAGESGSDALTVPVGGLPFARCCLAARSDDNGALDRSRLQLWVDGNAYPKAHAGHDVIRAGTPGTFSHWTDGVRFALPDGQDNDETAAVQFTYPIQIPNIAASLALIAATALALVLSIIDILYRVGATVVRRARASIAFAASRPGRARAKSGSLAVLAALRGRRQALALLLVVAVPAALAIECGAWQRTQVIAGPFAEEAGDKMLSAPVDRGSRLLWLLAPRGDIQTDPYRSRLSLTVGGKPYPEAHSIHDPIRDGVPGVFSHWMDEVRFALPSGVPNSPDTRLTLTYPLQFAHPELIFSALAALFAFWLFLERPWLTPDRTSRLLRRPLLAAVGLVGLSAAAACAYAVATAAAWAQGWALPSAEPIAASKAVRWLAMAEPHVYEIIIDAALVGAVAGWLADSRRIDLSTHETRARRLLSFVGLPVLFAFLMFSLSAQWAGLSREGDLSNMSIAGLIPFSDASNYFGEAHDAVRDGIFGDLGSRRPIAQVFRSTLMALADYRYTDMLTLQILLLSVAIFVAAAAVVRWRGLWAGIAFAALCCITAREFDATALTESLGLFWGLFAVPPLVRALRDRSTPHALLTVGLLFLALLTRMGSMFTVPALVFWMPFFGDSRRAKGRLCGAAVAVLIGVASCNAVAARLYTADAKAVGSNFSYSLCGLTIGGTWSDCLQRYKASLPDVDVTDPGSSERRRAAEARLMYAKAYENFRDHPDVFFKRVASGSIAFLVSVPETLLQGYQPVSPLLEAGLAAAEIVLAFGLLRYTTRMRAHEAAFWSLFWASAVASAGFVFFDDGRRVMSAIYPIMSLFIVLGLGSSGRGKTGPTPILTADRSAPWGAFAAAALLATCLVMPLIEHRFFRPSVYVAAGPAAPTESVLNKVEQFGFGSSRMAGVLIVSDQTPLPRDVPAMHLSDFSEIIRRSRIERDYQKLITPAPPAVPFAFIETPELVSGEPTYMKFIAPADVLLRKDVPAWHFDTVPLPGRTPGDSLWLDVTKAVPLGAPGPTAAAMP